MGNNADLAMVQKTFIDTLHKEGKSQRVITERGGCSRNTCVLVAQWLERCVSSAKLWVPFPGNTHTDNKYV